MKLLTTILLIIITTTLSAQVGKVGGWNTYTTFSGSIEAGKKYPALIFFPGLGEVGISISKLVSNGPHRFIIDGGNPLPGWYVISLQPPAAYPNEVAIKLRIDSLVILFNLDTNRINLTGLSHGGWCSSTFVSGIIQVNTLIDNASIDGNTLSLGYIGSNTVRGGNSIRNNTLSANGSIEQNVVSRGYIYNNTLNTGKIQYNTLINGDISSNTLNSLSRIFTNTLENGAVLQIGLSNPIIGKTIQKNTFISTTAFNTDMSAATIIYGNYEKTFYKRPDNTNKVRYYNNSDTLVIGDVTD